MAEASPLCALEARRIPVFLSLCCVLLVSITAGAAPTIVSVEETGEIGEGKFSIQWAGGGPTTFLFTLQSPDAPWEFVDSVAPSGTYEGIAISPHGQILFTVVAGDYTFSASEFASLNLGVVPDIPAHLRDLRMFENGSFVRPALPALRTTADGRIGSNMATGQLVLVVPEKPTTHVLDPSNLGIEQVVKTSAGVPHLYAYDFEDLFDANSFDGDASGAFNGAMFFVCDPSNGKLAMEGTLRRNPFTCDEVGGAADDDCYDIVIIGNIRNSADDYKHHEVWGRKFRITVSNPKTENAAIASIEPLDAPMRAGWHGQYLTGGVQAIHNEPMVTSDGRLYVARSGQIELPQGNFNMLYSVNDTGAPCDLTAWTDLQPITHAPYDARINGSGPLSYGFALYPWRDNEGNAIGDGERFHGNYPWVDRDGDNIFFMAAGATLHYFPNENETAFHTRFPSRCVEGQICEDSFTYSEWMNAQYCVNGADPEQSHIGACTGAGGTVNSFVALEDSAQDQGLSLLGSWTHGKVVTVDSLVNNVDFGLPANRDQQRRVKLYAPNTGAAQLDPSGYITVGAGRDNLTGDNPRGTIGNTNIVDSFEHLVNFRSALRPETPRDVVWIMNAGRGSDEVVFDDFLDLDMLIYSDMNASTYNPPSAGELVHAHEQRDGAAAVAGYAHTRNILNMTGEKAVQNAATAPRFGVVPKRGELSGNTRIEPVANGGIVGKGLWLDGAAHVRYVIDTATDLDPNDAWTVSMFIDSRSPTAEWRELFTLPDGTKIEMFGNMEKVRVGESEAAIPVAMRDPYYNHVAFGSSTTDTLVYVNGLLAGSVANTIGISVGDLYVGDVDGGNPGFRGWIDELRVMARHPDPESMCNQARGRLYGTNDASGHWVDVAASYPSAKSYIESFNISPTYANYFCFHDYTTDNALPGAETPDVGASVDISGSIVFPEGQFAHDQPRPDSSANMFCRSCHSSDNAAGSGLTEAALSYESSIPMKEDPRRQPKQPARFISGNLPANYCMAETGVPTPAMSGGDLHFDECNFP